MYSLNPTLIPYNNSLYLLLRKETDIKNWENSIMTYELHLVNKNFKTLLKEDCLFQYKDHIYSKVSRSEWKENEIAFEDIKFLFIKNKKIYGISNILFHQKNPRIFRVGIIEINIKNKILKLYKVLETKNMSNTEKNWVLYPFQGKYYIITHLIPYLKIYEVSGNFQLIPRVNKYIYNIDSYLLSRLHHKYKILFLSPCQSPIQIHSNYLLFFTKKKLENCFYQYYICMINLTNYRLRTIPILIEEGYKMYLNSVHVIEGRIIGCYGIADKDYEVREIFLPESVKKSFLPFFSNYSIKL